MSAARLKTSPVVRWINLNVLLSWAGKMRRITGDETVLSDSPPTDQRTVVELADGALEWNGGLLLMGGGNTGTSLPGIAPPSPHRRSVIDVIILLRDSRCVTYQGWRDIFLRVHAYAIY